MTKVKFENHILLCGCVDHPERILQQLFAPDLKDFSPVVIIDPDIEKSPMDHPLLKVIKGDPTQTKVLMQANAQKARSAIVLADHKNRDIDARSLMIVLAIETLQPEIYSCVEVLNPDNMIHFERVGVDEAICVSDISNSLVVQAALNPNVSRLICDMLTIGQGEELYELGVPSAFVGRTFSDLSTTLMLAHEMVLVGVVSERKLINSRRSRWTFRQGDRIFVLAEDRPDGLDDLSKTKKG